MGERSLKTRSWRVATPSRRPAGQSGTRKSSRGRELELAEVVKRLGEKMLDGDSLLQTNRQDAVHRDHILRSRVNLLSSLNKVCREVWAGGHSYDYHHRDGEWGEREDHQPVCGGGVAYYHKAIEQGIKFNVEKADMI